VVDFFLISVDAVVETFEDDDFFVFGDVDAVVEFWVMVDVAIIGNVAEVVAVVAVVLWEDSGIGVSGNTLVVIVEFF